MTTTTEHIQIPLTLGVIECSLHNKKCYENIDLRKLDALINSDFC